MNSDPKRRGESLPAQGSIRALPEELRHVDRLATIGRVATGLVHELGVKLAVVGAHAEMIARGEVDGESARASALIMAQQIDRVTEDIHLLLDFARDQNRERSTFDLRSLAQRTTELFAAHAGRQAVTLRVSSGDPMEIAANPAQMEQVVATLVQNAIEACPSGGNVGVSVTEAIVHGASTVCLELVYDGAGLRRGDQFRGLGPASAPRDTDEEAGLGLLVVREIVRGHGGWIEFESAPGGGKRHRFRVHLRRPAPTS